MPVDDFWLIFDLLSPDGKRLALKPRNDPETYFCLVTYHQLVGDVDLQGYVTKATKLGPECLYNVEIFDQKSVVPGKSNNLDKSKEV